MPPTDPEPRVRRAPIPDDAVLVIRGDDLKSDTAKGQATAFRRRFPAWHRWGLSAFCARSDAEIDDLAADQLERFPRARRTADQPSPRLGV